MNFNFLNPQTTYSAIKYELPERGTKRKTKFLPQLFFLIESKMESTSFSCVTLKLIEGIFFGNHFKTQPSSNPEKSLS